MANDKITTLNELLQPATRAFSQESAEALLNYRVSDTAQARIAQLAGKANAGLLTKDERSEYESCVRILDLISVLQAKARVWLSEAK